MAACSPVLLYILTKDTMYKDVKMWGGFHDHGPHAG